MAVQITNRTYTNLYRAETTSFLKGNTGDWINVKLEVATTVENNYTMTNSLNFVGPNKLINLDGTNWHDQGFAVGDSISIFYSVSVLKGGDPVPGTEVRNIDSIQGNELVYDGANIIPLYMSILPGQTVIDISGTFTDTVTQSVQNAALVDISPRDDIDENDIVSILEDWLQKMSENTFNVNYADLDVILKLPKGSTEKHIEQAANQHFRVVRKGKTEIRLTEYQPDFDGMVG